MKKQLTLVMQPGPQRYDCAGCGACCSGRFAINITQADRDRIEGQAWNGDELGLAGKPLFTRADGGYKLAHRADGSCIFLQQDGKCLIHARHGAAGKPVACRLYPFTFVPMGDKIRVDVRFDCPSVAGNHGRPIAAYKADLLELMKSSVPGEALTDPVPPLRDKIVLTWPQLARVTEAFERVLLDISLDITHRVTACVDLVDILRQFPVESLEAGQLGDFLDEAASKVQQDAIDDVLERPEKAGPEGAAFRQLLNVYGRFDRVGAKADVLKRLRTSLGMLAGKGVVPPLRDDFPKVTFADIDNARGIPSGDAALSAERYLHVHLASMGFFGRPFYGRSYLDGIGALLLTYPLLCWFARAFAIAEGLPIPDAACVERAIAIVDHQHGITPVLDIPTERVRVGFLCERAVLRSLIVKYGS